MFPLQQLLIQTSSLLELSLFHPLFLGIMAFRGSTCGKTFKNKGVASIEELRGICIESGVKMIGCQMTMDVFGFSKDEFIDGVEVGGAATFLEFATDSDIQLFI